jgi:hypothetical protein
MTSDRDIPDGEPLEWWRKALMVILAPIVLPTTIIVVGIPLLILAGFALPVSAIAWQIDKRRERRFRHVLTERGRCVSWCELQPTFESRGGTVLIEWRHKRPPRVWWTPDDVSTCAPCDPPEVEKLDFLGIQSPHPFIRWCHRQYVNDVDGSARWTHAGHRWMGASPGHQTRMARAAGMRPGRR